MIGKLLIVFGVAFILSVIFCRIAIPILRRANAGQNILSYVKEHKKKEGTPTMGGLAFLSAAVLTCVCFEKEMTKSLVLALVIGLSYMLIGFLDDLMKHRRQENLGLRAWQKLLFQAAVAIFSGIFCMRAGYTTLYIPYTKSMFQVGAAILPISIFVYLASVNAVNLTDGLDGLAASVSIPFFLTLGLLPILQESGANFSILSFCISGALVGYLLFNVSPATIFMGDTGSLSLGGFAASIALFSGNVLYLAVIGICFVLSVISVVLQVIYYKATGGKRIFLMAPLHHHFQKKGYSETRICYAYFVVTLIVCISVLVGYM